MDFLKVYLQCGHNKTVREDHIQDYIIGDLTFCAGCGRRKTITSKDLPKKDK